MKSFSLGQNEPTFTELKDNKVKIIISINNTQNRNYINKKKFRKIENFSTKNKKSISHILEDNYLKCHSNLGIYNKNNSLLHQTIKNNRKNNSSNKNKSINQTYLFEPKNYLNSNSNNNIIKYNPMDCYDLPYIYDLNRNTNKNSYIKKNYIKTDNNSNCQYFSMINNNSTNNFSNIIINNDNNNNRKNLIKGKNVFKLKKIVKTTNINNNEDSTILRRINSDGYQNIYITNNNINKKKSQINTKINHTNNLTKYNESNRHSKNSKSSIINKLFDKNIKRDLNKTVNINKTDNKISSNIIKNLDINTKNQNINNFNSKLNSNIIKNKNKKYIKFSFSNSNKTTDKESPKIIEINNGKNIKKLFSELKSNKKIKKFHDIIK